MQRAIRIKEKTIKGKPVYSDHEPHLTCITKNKAGKKPEYGGKVSLAVNANGFVIVHQEYPDNRHDSTTLGDALSNWTKATGSLQKALGADRGYPSQKEREPDLLAHVPKEGIPWKGKAKSRHE